MTIRVARVPYLSHEPFYFDMANRGLVLHNFVRATSLRPLKMETSTPGLCLWATASGLRSE